MSIRTWIGAGMTGFGAMMASGCGNDVTEPVELPDPVALLGTLTGTVSRSGEPVPDATVTISDGTKVKRTAKTGLDGTFAFRSVPPGNYVVGATRSDLFCEERTAYLQWGGTAKAEVACVGMPDFSAGAGIYVAEDDGSGIRFLTDGNRPAWSPDGGRIAFDRLGQIYVIEIDGSNETWLAQGRDPSWSPDGGSIVYADSGGISAMKADGSGITRLIRDEFVQGTPSWSGIGKPAWSPDGGSIAFEHFGDGDILPAQIYIMNADGSGPRRLTSADGNQYAESDPAWLPDGSSIMFWSYGYGIATVGAKGGAVRVTYINFPFVSYGAKPELSTDGDTILLTTRRWEISSAALYVIDRDGSGLRVLIPGGYDAAWSPDGARIAFVHGTPDD